MARRKTPGGRRVPVSFKLTEAERDLVDSLRGGTGRNVWLREAAMTVVNGNTGIPEPAARGEAPVVRSGRRPPVAVAVPSREPEPAARPRGKGPCEHRVPPGSYCRSCQRMI